jgi:hypothetical protein
MILDFHCTHERRAMSRYPLQKPLRYRAAGGTLASLWKQGRALDMSAQGILIAIPETMAIGARLELAVDWTGLYHDRQAMRLFLIATVTGIENRGIALRILSHRFRDVRPTAVRPQRAERKLAVA